MKKLMLFLLLTPFALRGDEEAQTKTYFDQLIKFCHPELVYSSQSCYRKMIDAFQEEDWKNVVLEGEHLVTAFPDHPYASEARYFVGLAYFNRRMFDFANNYFSEYLKEEIAPKYFMETLHYKFEIAQFYEDGNRKHLLGRKKLPKWSSGKEDAIEIYDEVIRAMPREDLAAESLFRKGYLLLDFQEYQQSIDTFQTLIRRFPKHPFAIESFLGIANVYLRQSTKEFPDPNHLDLAEINLRKFRAHFPGEPRLVDAEKMVLSIREELAGRLLEIAAYYDKTKKGGAAALYYQNIIAKYPGTNAAKASKKRLEKLDLS